MGPEEEDKKECKPCDGMTVKEAIIFKKRPLKNGKRPKEMTTTCTGLYRMDKRQAQRVVSGKGPALGKIQRKTCCEM